MCSSSKFFSLFLINYTKTSTEIYKLIYHTTTTPTIKGSGLTNWIIWILNILYSSKNLRCNYTSHIYHIAQFFGSLGLKKLAWTGGVEDGTMLDVSKDLGSMEGGGLVLMIPLPMSSYLCLKLIQLPIDHEESCSDFTKKVIIQTALFCCLGGVYHITNLIP